MRLEAADHGTRPGSSHDYSATKGAIISFTRSASQALVDMHKSFGDYLAARAILSVAFDLISFVDRRIEAAMKEWYRCRNRNCRHNRRNRFRTV
jgi:hypothetical protein